MHNQPLISIITPAYNAERFIQQTIASVRAQSYPNWEHLVVIDVNSADGTQRLVEQVAKTEPRLKCVLSPKAKGAAQNRNVGLAQACGEFVAFLDADDLWTADKLEKQLAFMQAKNCDFSYTGYSRMALDGSPLGEPRQVPLEMSYEDILKNNEIGCLTVMLRRKAFTKIEFQDFGWEDMSLWLQLLKDGRHAYGLNEPLALYRIVPGSRSNNKVKAAKLRWDTYRIVERMDFFKSCYYFSFYFITAVRKYARL